MCLDRSLYRACRLVLFVLPFAVPLCGQQRYVSKYDLFTGYTHFNSSPISLTENGFHTQIGMRPRTWYSLGFDYSIVKGSLTLTPDLLPTDLQQKLGAQLAQLAAAGLLPAGYHLTVPSDSVTQTFAAGPQLSFRKFSKVTFFLRPSLGAIREHATPKPGDPIATAIVKQLSPTGSKTDWQGFYGVGGGLDITLSKHLAFRIQADHVWDHLFNDILKDGRFTTRFSVGPAFNFGRNIVE
jgi:hypothetical protein